MHLNDGGYYWDVNIISCVDNGNKYWKYNVTRNRFFEERVSAEKTTVYYGKTERAYLHKVYKRPSRSSITKIYRLLFPTKIIYLLYRAPVDRFIFYVPKGTIWDEGVIK